MKRTIAVVIAGIGFLLGMFSCGREKTPDGLVQTYYDADEFNQGIWILHLDKHCSRLKDKNIVLMRLYPFIFDWYEYDEEEKYISKRNTECFQPCGECFNSDEWNDFEKSIIELNDLVWDKKREGYISRSDKTKDSLNKVKEKELEIELEKQKQKEKAEALATDTIL